MTVGIIGTRRISAVSMRKFAKFIPKECTGIVSGGALGIDSCAEKYANINGISFVKILPDYEIFGKIAPIVRNTTIVKKSDKVIAFWDYKSRGTAHVIKECLRLGVPVEIISVTEILEISCG